MPADAADQDGSGHPDRPTAARPAARNGRHVSPIRVIRRPWSAAMALLGYSEPKPTLLGIAVLIAAATVMPWLAKEKRRLSASTGSAALRADAAESALCAYLSVIALLGLAVNAIWRVAWADPVAASAVVPLIIWEGRQAIRGKACGCCSLPRYS